MGAGQREVVLDHQSYAGQGEHHPPTGGRKDGSKNGGQESIYCNRYRGVEHIKPPCRRAPFQIQPIQDDTYTP